MELSGYWERIATLRYRRRQFLKMAALSTGVSSWALAACQTTGTTSAPATTGASAPAATVVPQPGRAAGKLIWNWAGISEALDPSKSVSAAGNFWALTGNLAVYINKQTWAVEPQLIEKWEVPSPDTILLHVRKGVKWHNVAPVNGRELNAEDIAYTINRHAGKLDPANQGLYPRRGNYVGLDKAEVVDSSTVRLRMSKPSFAIFNGMGDYRTNVISRETETTGFSDMTKVAGTGPWVISTLAPDGRMSLIPNESYWQPNLPQSAGVDLVVIKDAQAINASFLSKQIDFLGFTNRPAVDVAAVQAGRPDAKILKWDFGYWHYLRFNMTRKPVSDVRVRRALQLSLDVQDLAKGYYGNDWVYTGPLTASFIKEAISPTEIATMPGWNPQTKERDIAEAKQLMSAAGYPDGDFELKGISLGTGPHAANFQRAVSQWQRIWPKLRFSLDDDPDSASMFRKTAALDWDIQAYAIFPSPDAVLEVISNYTPAGGRNYGKYDNASVTDAATRALYTPDEKERTSLLRQIQQTLISEMPLIALYFPKQVALLDGAWQGIESFPGPGGAATVDLWEGSKLVRKGK